MHNSDFSWRVFAFRLLIISVFVVFALRLVELQLVRGSEFRQRADENRFFTRYLPASRGIITDRKGVALVANTPEYKKATAATFNQPFPTLESIDEATAKNLLAVEDKNVFIDEKRTYPFGPTLSQVLGYTGEVTQDELQAHSEYALSENIGKVGLEKLFQRQLAGVKGRTVFEMQANGQLLRKVLDEQPTPGADLQLTLDASLSAKAYDLLAGKRGAVVVSDVHTGEVLVLVSSPSFDPTNLGPSLNDPNFPMLNRTIAGAYPPGSTFKLMTALAGLKNAAITPDTKVNDTGELKVAGFSFKNWFFSEYGRVEGDVDLLKAIQRSNDIYFYTVAGLIGPDKLAQMAKLFHYGSPTGIELGGEVGGVVPTPEWKQRALGQQWYLGDTYHMGIGQGDVLVTPLQVNQTTAAIADNGTWCAPHLLKQTETNCSDLGVKKADLDMIYEGMKLACLPGGTAFPFFDQQPVPVACKTGTAEFGAADSKGRRKTHALFTAAVPADNPHYAVTVLVEGTEDKPFLEGSADAAPIAKEMVKLLMGQ
ncbi:MAG TPA: penicillin-binding transpeptidase domain-containing protein [Candidatus Saccharimonadia bacterium]|nr:penicillin-binding transpeptidase domain-containing protein [Candidatus Saccharimonadia bacterium]